MGCVKANCRKMGENYNEEPSAFILYVYANNLYNAAISAPTPQRFQMDGKSWPS